MYDNLLFSRDSGDSGQIARKRTPDTAERAIEGRRLPARAAPRAAHSRPRQRRQRAGRPLRGRVLMAASLTDRGIVRLCSVSWYRGGYLTFWPNSDAKISALVPYSSPQKSSQKPTFLPLKTAPPLASFLTHVPFAALRSHFRTNQVLT